MKKALGSKTAPVKRQAKGRKRTRKLWVRRVVDKNETTTSRHAYCLRFCNTFAGGKLKDREKNTSSYDEMSRCMDSSEKAP